MVCIVYIDINNDENVHRYAVRGERYRKRERERESEWDNDREKKEIWYEEREIYIRSKRGKERRGEG